VQIEDTSVAGAATGIEIRGTSMPVLRADAIENCTDTGIRITGNSAPQLRHNTIVSDGHGVVAEAPARPVLEGNTFGDNAGEQMTLPEGMDREAIAKLNLFLKAARPARTPRGAPR
jgi:hypothetical protein